MVQQKVQMLAPPLKTEQVDSVAFVLGVGHHIVISYHQDEYENTEKICKESKVLIVEHLQAQVEYVALIPHQKQEAVFLWKHSGFRVQNHNAATAS